MMRNLVTVAALFGGAAFLAPAVSSAGAKDKPTLAGAWVVQGGELKIEFAGDVMKIYPHGENKVIIVVCEAKADKKGLVKAKISQIEATQEIKDKVGDKLPVGLEFTFSWTVRDEVATLADVKGEKTDLLKGRLPGKYEPKK